MGQYNVTVTWEAKLTPLIDGAAYTGFLVWISKDDRTVMLAQQRVPLTARTCTFSQVPLDANTLYGVLISLVKDSGEIANLININGFYPRDLP